jgi:hypothetical protein
MLLRVGTVLVGTDKFDVLCRDKTHAWQAQLSGGTMLLAASVEDAVAQLLAHASARRR